MTNDFSYDKINEQLRRDYDHILKMFKLVEDSPPDMVFAVGYYCRGILNGSKLLWEHTSRHLIWIALYVKVEQMLSKVITTSISPSFIESDYDKEFVNLRDNPGYLDQVLNSFCTP